MYHERWEMETTLKEMKTNLRGAKVVLRSKTPNLVRQEFYGLWLAHFAVRRLMHEAALKKDIDPDELSFKRVFKSCAASCPMLGLFSPESYAIWYAELINCVSQAKCISSRGKRNLRVVKRRTRYYPLRNGGEPLDVRLQAFIRIENASN